MRAARSFPADEAILQDLVQNAYLRLFQNNGKALRNIRAEHPNSIYAYLGAVASGTVFDYIRANGTNKRGGATWTISLSTLATEIETLAQPENQLESTLLIDKIDTLLDEILPEKTRVRDKAVFWLRYRQGFTVRMIAKSGQHGLSEEGIESLLARIIKALRERLK